MLSNTESKVKLVDINCRDLRARSTLAVGRRVVQKFFWLSDWAIVPGKSERKTTLTTGHKHVLIASSGGYGDIAFATYAAHLLRRQRDDVEQIDLLCGHYHRALSHLTEQYFDCIHYIPLKYHVGRIPTEVDLLSYSGKLNWDERYISPLSKETDGCVGFTELICKRHGIAWFEIGTLRLPDTWRVTPKNQVFLNINSNSIVYHYNWTKLVEQIHNVLPYDVVIIINGAINIHELGVRMQQKLIFFDGSYEDLIMECLASRFVVSTRSGLNDTLCLVGFTEQFILYPDDGADLRFFSLTRMGFDVNECTVADFMPEKLRGRVNVP